MTRHRGNRVLSGNHGVLYWENEELAFIKKFSLNIKENREDVIIGMDVDSKRTSVSAEGEIELEKVDSKLVMRLLKNIKDGKDERFHLIAMNADPDAIGSQKERISVPNVWLDEYDLMAFEKGEKQTNSLKFGCTVTDIDFIEGII